MNSVHHQDSSTIIPNSEVQEFLPNLPDELALNVLQYLTPKELLLGTCLVSKKWKALAGDEGLWQSFDLKKILSHKEHINHINEEVWAKHVNLKESQLSFAGMKRLDLLKALPKILKVASLKTEEKGITILSVPSGISINAFKEILSTPSDLPPASFIEFYGRQELENLEAETVKTPYQVVITHSHITCETIHRASFTAQLELLAQSGCKMPDLVSSALHIGMTYLTVGKKLYQQDGLPDQNLKLTACSNVIEGELPHTFAGAFIEHEGNRAFGIAAFGQEAMDLPYCFGSAAMINLSEEAGIEN